MAVGRVHFPGQDRRGQPRTRKRAAHLDKQWRFENAPPPADAMSSLVLAHQPTTVKADAFLLSARRWHVHASPGRARTRQRERTAAAPARQRRSASAQLSSENHGSRAGV